MRCRLCWDSGRVATIIGPSQPCPRCEPEECAAGVPCCRLCGGVMFTIPGQRSNLGWLCQRCSPRDRRPHAELLAGAVRPAPIDWPRLLLSMIHINTLALALFEAGKTHASPRIIAIVGILNLPYYLLLIALTYTFQDAVMEVGENPYYLLVALLIWCLYSVYRYKRGIHPVSP